MKKKFLTILITLIFFSINNNLFVKADTSGADFLKFPPSAKSISLGESYSTYKNDIDIIYYNVAGITSLKEKQILFTYFVLGDEMNLEYLGFGFPHSNNFFGIGLIFFHLPFTQFGDAGEKIEDTNIYDLCLTMSYGRNILGIETGINLKYIHRNLVGNKANAFALDFGIIKRFEFLSFLNKESHDNFSLGISIRNLGTKVKFQNIGDKLPLPFNIGCWYEVLKNLIFLFDLDKYYKEESFIFKFGTEYSIFNILFLRIGDRIENGENSFSLGGGIEYKIKNFIISANYGFCFQIDYNNIYVLSLKIRFWIVIFE